MRLIALVLSLTLGLTTAAHANKLWECTVPEAADGIDAQLTRFEDKVIEMWDDGTIFTYHCNTDKMIATEFVKKDICVMREDNALYLAIFDEVGRTPSSYTVFEILFKKEIDVYQPYTIKLEDCKEQ